MAIKDWYKAAREEALDSLQTYTPGRLTLAEARDLCPEAFGAAEDVVADYIESGDRRIDMHELRTRAAAAARSAARR